MTAFMTLKREQSEELPNNNEKILQHYVEKMGDLIAVSDEGVSENYLLIVYIGLSSKTLKYLARSTMMA